MIVRLPVLVLIWVELLRVTVVSPITGVLTVTSAAEPLIFNEPL